MVAECFRDAMRSLRRHPGFALLTVGILAVGVGLNAAIFTVIDCVLLRPLGYRDADRIVAIQTRFLEQNRTIPRLGGGDYVDVATQVHNIESAAYYSAGDGGVQVRGNSAIEHVAYVSPRFGEVLGVESIAGRNFGHDDSKGTEAVVSAAFARDHFGSAGSAVGQAVRGDGGLYTIVGVLPDGFDFPQNTTVWFEDDAQPQNLNRTSYSKSVVAKVRGGVTMAALQAEITNLSYNLQRANADDHGKVLEAISLQERVVGKVAPTLRLLMAAVTVILLIVCANITHLQLVRATRQMREIAVRSALGASRAGLAARAVVEALLLGLAGCAGAILIAWPALRLLVHLAPAELPRLADVRLNWHVLVSSFLVSSTVMILTALLPVWRSWHVDQAVVLRQDSARGLEGRGIPRLRAAFLVIQVAFTLLLAATSVLLARQLIAQSREDLGFNMEHLYTLDTNMIAAAPRPANSLSEGAAQAVYLADSLRKLQRLQSALDVLHATAGVVDAEAIEGAPLGFGGSDVLYAIRGRTAFGGPDQHLPDADIRPVTPGALRTLGVPLLHGRALTGSDVLQSQHVLLISRALADQQFHNGDPIGKQVLCGYDAMDDWWTIVGVVEDLKTSPGGAPAPTFYVPLAQHPARAAGMQLLVRTAPGAHLSEELLRQRLAPTHPDIAVHATSMAQNFDEVQRELRFRTVLFESFAGVSILLAMLGMYGATTYSVAQRTFEFGLRMALGATRAQVLSHVLRKAMWVALAGVSTGLLLYVALQRLLSAWLGKMPADPAALALATAGVALLTLFAAAIPARRASGIDPLRALRTD